MSRRVSWHSANRLSKILTRLSLSAASMRRRCSSPPISAACCLKAALMMPCATSIFLAGSGGSTSAICIAIVLSLSEYKHRLIPRFTVAIGPEMTLYRSPSACCVRDETNALHGLEPGACARADFSPVTAVDTERPQPFPPLPHAPILPPFTRAHPVLPFTFIMWLSSQELRRQRNPSRGTPKDCAVTEMCCSLLLSALHRHAICRCVSIDNSR